MPLHSLCCMLFTMQGKAGEDARPPFIFLIRNHSLYFRRIRVAYQIAVTKLTFALLILRGQDVAKKRMSALHFPGRGFLKALSSALVSL